MMIVKNIKTDISLNPTESKVLSTTASYNNKEFYKSKLMSHMTNNIIHEITELKQKNKQSEMSYINHLKISDLEYQRSLKEMNSILENLNEEDLIEVVSVKKLISVYRHIFEIFAYFIGEAFFDWKQFKEKINLHVIKFKMSNIKFENFSNNMMNSFLNKISKNKNFSNEFIDEYRTKGINKIFKWIKAVFKVFLYKKQNNEINSKNMNPSGLSSNAFSPINKSGLINAADEVNPRGSRSDLITSIVNLKLIDQKHEDLYVTQLNQVNNQSKSNKNITNKNVIDNSVVKRTTNNFYNNVQVNSYLPHLEKKQILYKRELKLNFDFQDRKIKMEKKMLKSLPFVRNKTFHQLRNFYNLMSRENDIVNEDHFKQIEKISLKNPENLNKILTFLASNKMKAIDDETFNSFITNLKFNEENEVIRSRILK